MTARITSGQEVRIDDFVRDMMRKELEGLEADKLAGQCIISQGGELRARMKEILVDLGLMHYKFEEVQSNYGYPQGFAVRPVCEQLLTLANIFPGLDTSKALACSREKRALPEWADGLGVFPKWQAIAKSYNEAVEKVMAAIKKSGRPFKNWREGELGPKYLRQSERKEKAIAAISAKQEGDFIVFPIQLGLRHRGRSMRRACEVMRAVEIVERMNEFGLGAYEGGISLLTHPDRFVAYENLWMDLPGDKYSPDASPRFGGAPYFGFFDARLLFSTDRVGSAYAGYGSASGSVPQSL